MGLALEAGYDLAGLAACYVAVALLVLAVGLTSAIAAAFDFSIFGQRPLHGVANALHNHVVKALNSAIHDLEKTATRFESGLIDAFGILIAIPLLLAFAVKAALSYLWNHALVPKIKSITNPISTTASQALTKVGTLENTVADNLTSAEKYADTASDGALSAAKTYADKWIDNAVHSLNAAVRAAVAEAEKYADQAVAKLRGAEDAAVAEAVGLAAAAKAAGIAAAAGALRTAENELGDVRNEALSAAAAVLTTAEHYTDAIRGEAIGAAAGALATAEQYADALKALAEADAAAALATAQAAGLEALGTVKAIAVDTGHELADLEGIYGALGTATLIASIPALATLVHAIASEAGLENASCRGKVKNICGTDPAAWAKLLEGAALVGLAFDFPMLVNVARGVIDEGADLMRAVV